MLTIKLRVLNCTSPISYVIEWELRIADYPAASVIASPLPPVHLCTIPGGARMCTQWHRSAAVLTAVLIICAWFRSVLCPLEITLLSAATCVETCVIARIFYWKCTARPAVALSAILILSMYLIWKYHLFKIETPNLALHLHQFHWKCNQRRTLIWTAGFQNGFKT